MIKFYAFQLANTISSKISIAMSNNTKKYVSSKQLLALLVGMTSVILFLGFEGIAVTAIMPEVTRDLKAVTYYPLAAGMSMAVQIFSTALSGIWCDSKGPKKVIIVGTTIFTFGLILSGIASEIVLFIIGRAVQGLGAGMLIVPFYVIVGSVVEPTKRPMFFVVFSAAWIIPAIIGPYGASIINKYYGWRMVFLAIPPFVILAMLLLVPMLMMLKPKNLPITPKAKKVLLGALGGGFFIALSQIAAVLPTNQMVPAVLLCIALATFSIRFVLPEGTFSLREGISSIIAVRGLTLGIVIGSETLIPLILVIGRGWDVETVAFLVSIGSIGWFLGSFIQGRIKDKNSRKKLIPIGGIITIFGTVLSIIGIFDSINFIVLLSGWALSSLGTGLIVSTCSVLALEVTPEENHGDISSALQVGDSYGSALLLALIGVLYTPLSSSVHPWPYLPSGFLMFIVALIGFYAAWKTYTFTTKYYEENNLV